MAIVSGCHPRVVTNVPPSYFFYLTLIIGMYNMNMISLKKPYADLSEILQWIDPNKKVSVYRNLANGLWSVKQDGIVCCYAQRVILRDCICKVSLAGNARVRQEKRKGVHATINGYVADFLEIHELSTEGDNYIPPEYWNEITYNPYKDRTFVQLFGEARVPIRRAWIIDMDSKRSPKVMGHAIS